MKNIKETVKTAKHLADMQWILNNIKNIGPYRCFPQLLIENEANLKSPERLCGKTSKAKDPLGPSSQEKLV